MAASCKKVFLLRSAVLILIVCSNLVHTIQVMYESFEQINNTDTAEFLGRVKKVNRTTAALNGELIIKKALNNDYKIKLDFWHSPLGNQQFNYYPMKIPPTGMCDFSKGLWQTYEQFYRDYVTNNLRVGECPMEPRTIQITNHLLDS
ncbi:conserved hypothetical protein [Culex quinquefasciatus]|uniref:Uncharacterized protein n=1 Tax=Culex quinquefasciatus TaxID=7176 RepID=B0XFF6_CULQU|nr:uncharacterized protein LOC6052046 [Culex quinquefasciatus]EDS26729.1 conserved hypothetical protein [Culex quinquefasciatus]|eukprot:XP_001868378.1 conserved hypothetical protein [Culex quinquefasciatus]